MQIDTPNVITNFHRTTANLEWLPPIFQWLTSIFILEGGDDVSHHLVQGCAGVSGAPLPASSRSWWYVEAWKLVSTIAVEGGSHSFMCIDSSTFLCEVLDARSSTVTDQLGPVQ